MSIAERRRPPWDSGLQNERTRLAWQRTTLSGLTCSLLVARLLATDSLALAIAVGLSAVVSSAALGWFTTRRYTENHLALHRRQAIDATRAQLVVTMLVVVTALAALVYVALL
ncbi:MAG TPA: DUF202 domain-containing protein [Propionibacteriaceae bacterium]|nr:DUF202 domain-containing protein [Propionibacteriaceae bacterium]